MGEGDLLSEWLRKEQDEMNAANAMYANEARQKAEYRISQLEESIPHILERLHALEEKERARAREEHERDVS